MSSCANANGMAGSRAHPRASDAPLETNRATASARPRRLSVLAAFVLGLPLFDEGLHAFARVLALEETDERVALDPETLLERTAVALDGGELDLSDRVARTLRVRPRAFDRARLQIRRGHELVDDAGILRLLRRERRPAQHQLERLLTADEARQPLRTAGAGKQAQRHLGQSDLVAALRRDAEVAAQRDLQSTAEAVSVDRRDDDLGRALELARRLVGAHDERVLRVEVALREDRHVRARGEELLGGAAHHDGPDAVVRARVLDRGVELLHERAVVGVGRWAVEDDVSDHFLLLESHGH